MERVNRKQRTGEEGDQNNEADAARIRQPRCTDRDREKRRCEHRSGYVAHVEAHGVDRSRGRAEEVIPDADRIAEGLAGGGVEVLERRSFRSHGDDRVCDKSGLRTDCRHVARAKELEDHGEGGDLGRRGQCRPGSNERDAENGRDERARRRMRNMPAPNQMGCDVANGADHKRDHKHLEGAVFEDDQTGDNGRSERDSRDDVVGQRGRFERGPVQQCRDSTQHASDCRQIGSMEVTYGSRSPSPSVTHVG